MATYTPNYRLHQWEPEDKFLRTDFNEDFAALDTALGRTARQGADTAYNLYDLFLRAGLEERAGGSQRAVLYDGFSDGEGMAGRDAPPAPAGRGPPALPDRGERVDGRSGWQLSNPLAQGLGLL